MLCCVAVQLGEIYERFYKNWDQSEKYYLNCSQSDPVRADAWFYLGRLGCAGLAGGGDGGGLMDAGGGW